MKKILSKTIIRKILFLSIMLICLVCVGVFAGQSDFNYVRVIYEDGHETVVLTNKTNVEDILNDGHVLISKDVNVFPSIKDSVDDNLTIIITKNLEDRMIVSEDVQNITTEEILGNYVTIVEKIIVEQVEIPYETITKDISTSDDNEDKVLQQGENGIKEITYRVKMQNDTIIEQEVISEEIIKEPVDKIIQIANKISSRSGVRGIAFSGSSGWSYDDEEMDLICAITAQEDSTSYEGALAVITTACNRAEQRGTDPLTEYKRKGQFCYTIDRYWVRRLNGNYANFVLEAVQDALNGARNHDYLNFRASGAGERIGSNVYR
jgi:hypothetical protein